MPEDLPPPEPGPPPFDPARFRTGPLRGREHLVDAMQFAEVVELSDDAGTFLDSLPEFLGVRALRRLAEAIARAPCALWGLGGHVVKVGLGPLLADLMERGFVHGLVLNGAAAIHDAEIALHGSTSEDVGGGLFEGRYGTADETGRLFADAAARAAAEGTGLGTALCRELCDLRPAHADHSILCAADRLRLPATVHVAIGTDTVHMHPHCDGAAVGGATHRDFLRLASLVEGLDQGVYVNVGSAVILPEVFLKAFAMAHNARRAEGVAERLSITTGNLDMLRQYRPRVNVLERPAKRGYDIAGQHEYTVPLLRLAVLKAAREGTT